MQWEVRSGSEGFGREGQQLVTENLLAGGRCLDVQDQGAAPFDARRQRVLGRCKVGWQDDPPHQRLILGVRERQLQRRPNRTGYDGSDCCNYFNYSCRAFGVKKL